MTRRGRGHAEDNVEGSDADEVYACTIRNHLSFDDVVTVCVSRRRDRIDLTVDAWPSEELVHKPLTLADWDHLKGALRLADFWALAANEALRGLDGATWTVAGLAGAKRHAVERWCPEPGELFHSLGVVFRNHAGLDTPAPTNTTGGGERTS